MNRENTKEKEERKHQLGRKKARATKEIKKERKCEIKKNGAG